MKSPPQDEKANVKAFNATVGLEAIEYQLTPSACERAKYLAKCINAHESLTEALAELKANSKS